MIAKLEPGKLPEYNSFTGPSGGFKVTVKIPIVSLQQRTFTGTEHPSKKAARVAAAKIAYGALCKDDAVSGTQQSHLSGLPTPSSVLRPNSEPSSCERLIQVTQRYRLPAPRYDLTANASSGTQLYSGSITFPNTSRFPGPLGEVSGVFGQRNAKEALAKQVLPEVERVMEMTEGLKLPGLLPELTYCERLVSFTNRYKLPPPRYDLTSNDSGSKKLYSGSISFPNAIPFPNSMGRIEGVFGQKNAKEELAKQVLPEVERVMEQRLNRILESG